VFIFKVTEPRPLQDSSSVRQKGGLPGPPPVIMIPDPESIAAKAVLRTRVGGASRRSHPGNKRPDSCAAAVGAHAST